VSTKLDFNWGYGKGCGDRNKQKWGPDSIYDIECNKCGTKVEFFKDEENRTCPGCKNKVFNEDAV